MAELRRVTSPTAANTNEKSNRPSSSSGVTKSLKKMPSEGLISLSPEPGRVKFAESSLDRPGSSGSARAESSLTKEMESLSVNKKSIGTEKMVVSEHIKDQGKSDSSDSETSSEESSGDETSSPETYTTKTQDKFEAPVELKGDFLSAVMDEDYEKAKDLCKQILLLEPDNATCTEFHSVLAEKIKQDEVQEDTDTDSDDDDDDDDDDNEDSSEEGDDEENEESSDDDEEDDDDDDSDDDFTPPTGPINLIMGGLPIKMQNR
ncbi:glutamate-rich protein 2 isoform X2 [Nematostella vectensis]|uniref:glutamate-rich protein 2 isoform X2 n=1 Tax=Nematostella vectensis TaxID=45351 RepID=UPI0020772D7A|nr:glutamate-rich protein 2 isoform X2 [Nematostella vectensis]